jgi:large exoprotein involved in heme utilization and adhesion
MKNIKYLAFLPVIFSVIIQMKGVAQITPDSTLRIEKSIVGENQVIKGIPSNMISGGARRGSNLFQSFSEFNVLEGRGVYFANPLNLSHSTLLKQGDSG